MPELPLQRLLPLQGLLRGCTKAIKQMHKPAKPGLHSACSLSTCQQPQLDPDSRLLTYPTIKSQLEGIPSPHPPSSTRQGGGQPVCCLETVKGSQVSCLLPAKAEPEGKTMGCLPVQAETSNDTPGHNFSPTAVQQDACVTREPVEVPQGTQSPMQHAQQKVTHGSALGRSSTIEAETGSNHGQAGFRLGIHQRPAEPVHEAAAVKRRCMPNWGKSN